MDILVGVATDDQVGMSSHNISKLIHGRKKFTAKFERNYTMAEESPWVSPKAEMPPNVKFYALYSTDCYASVVAGRVQKEMLTY